MGYHHAGFNMNSSNIKFLQETSIINDFISFFNNKRPIYKLHERPDPPDAIIENTFLKKFFWLEVTTEVYSKEWAIDLTSYAAPNRPHKSMQQKMYINMDETVFQRVINIFSKKSKKSSYDKVLSKYGKGMLIIKVYSPWGVDHDLLLRIKNEIKRKNRKTLFNRVYLYSTFGNGYAFTRCHN